MSEPFLGEIRVFGFNFTPTGWASCNGQLLSIPQNQALFSILGTTYGGDGRTTFALPNLQGQAPMHWGNGLGLTPRAIGDVLGASTETLLVTEMPAHNHAIQSAQQSVGTQSVAVPSASTWMGNSNPGAAYNNVVTTADVAFSPKAIGNSGGSQPHANVQPLLTLNFCIALEGIFPSRS